MSTHTMRRTFPVPIRPFLVVVALSARVGPAVSEIVSPQTQSVAATELNVILTQQPVANILAFGALCDGKSHPLSARFTSLALAQAVYPFITSLSQEQDFAGLQAASNHALGTAGSEHGAASSRHNVPIYIPASDCRLGDDTWTIRNAVGLKMIGAGRIASRIQGNKTVLAFDGLWYSQIEGIEFDTTSTSGVVTVDIDGNVPGHSYDTRGVQGNTIKDVLIDGGYSTYALALCRRGGSGGQCSENQYFNLHLRRASAAAYHQNGFNALDNNWFGGDIQYYEKNGAELIAGSIDFHKVSFESSSGYTQIANGGWDIDVSLAGAYDSVGVYGCRTESLRFYNGSFAQLANITGLHHTPSALQTWSGAEAYKLDTLVRAADSTGSTRAYRVTTAGTSGSSSPKWPTSGTVNDGSVVWTMLSYTAINVSGGVVDIRTSSIDPTATVSGPKASDAKLREVNASTTSLFDDQVILVDPTPGSVTITLSDDGNGIGRPITIKRSTKAAHDVTIDGKFGGNGVNGGAITLPSGTLDSVTVIGGGGGFVPAQWYMVNYTASSSH